MEPLFNVFQYSIYGNVFIFGFRIPYARAETLAEQCALGTSSNYQSHPVRRGDTWCFSICGQEMTNVWIEPVGKDRQWEFVKAFECYFTPDEIQQLQAVGVTTG